MAEQPGIDQWAAHVERYVSALAAADVGVWDWDIQGETFYLDPSVKALLGYEDHEIANDLELWTEYVHPDDREFVMEVATAHLEGKTPRYECEHRMLHKDGSVRWFRVQGVATRDDKGQAVRMVGTDTDITRRKEAEADLDRFFALSHDLLCITGTDGTFKRVNPSFERLLGYREDEMISYPVLNFVHEDDHEMTRSTAERHIGGGSAMECENRYRCKDGSYRTLLWNAMADVDSGLVFAIARDITEQRVRERQTRLAEKFDAVNTMVAGVGHLYNNLMMRVLGNADLAMASVDESSDARTYIESVREAARDAATLTARIASFAGDPSQIVGGVDLSVWLSSARTQLLKRIPVGIGLELFPEPDLPATRLDQQQLEQVMIGLVDNAVEALGGVEGSIQISTEARVFSDEELSDCFVGDRIPAGTYATISVRDSGPGIDKERQSRIFDPFFSTRFLGRGSRLRPLSRRRHSARLSAGRRVHDHAPVSCREPRLVDLVALGTLPRGRGELSCLGPGSLVDCDVRTVAEWNRGTPPGGPGALTQA